MNTLTHTSLAAALLLSAAASTTSVHAQAGRQQTAIYIRDDSRITLATSHPSGITDTASTARQNIVDAAACRASKTSAYSDVGVTSVWLHTGLLTTMRNLANTYGYTYRVTEIAGGDHSSTSYHYRGTAFDVGTINGSGVSSSNPYWSTFNQRCRNAGAVQSLGPGDTGHSTHVHNAWPTGTSASASGGCIHDKHVVGDWDGNGTVTPGVVRKEGGNLTWYLKNSNSGGTADITLTYGVDTDIPIVGDWDGNGTATVGVVRGATWLLRNSNSGGEAQISFNYGQTGDKFLAGDWDGNGTWTPGVVQGITWHLKNSLSGGSSDIQFGYGQTGDQFVVGDWDGNGTFTAGIYRSNDWYLKNSHSSGAADLTYGFGQAGDEAIPGNWNGSASNKTWTPGVIQDGNSWNLRNSNSTGVADITFVYGQ